MVSSLLAGFCNEILGICRGLVLVKAFRGQSMKESLLRDMQLSVMVVIPLWSAGSFFFSCMAILVMGLFSFFFWVVFVS